LEAEGGGWRAVHHNDTSHLAALRGEMQRADF